MTDLEELIILAKEMRYAGLEPHEYDIYKSLYTKAETAIKLQVIVKECIGHFNDKNTDISLILSEHLQMMVRASEE